MTLLEKIHSPADLKALSVDQLPQLAQEMRDRLIESCSITGGHIGASLGVVELAIALLYEFDSPGDKVLWDVGHQAYAWKLLTGRNEKFGTPGRKGGSPASSSAARTRTTSSARDTRAPRCRPRSGW